MSNSDSSTNLDELAALTSQQVADLLGVFKHTVERAARRGEIPSFKFGRSRRYRVSAIRALVEGRSEEKPPKND